MDIWLNPPRNLTKNEMFNILSRFQRLEYRSIRCVFFSCNLYEYFFFSYA